MILALVLTLALALAGDGPAHPDLVRVRAADGAVETLMGRVLEDSGARVVVEVGAERRELAPRAVLALELGLAPGPWREGVVARARGDLATAAARFAEAASGPDPVVGAHARLAAAECELRSGALASARRELEGFLAEHGASRLAPEARFELGRVERLEGNAGRAAETLAALFHEPGASPELAARAGLDAAEAELAAREPERARALHAEVARFLDALAPEDAPAALRARARRGEGLVRLALGDGPAALAFFRAELGRAAGEDETLGARLGLARALLATGDGPGARREFARVAALDAFDEERAALALVGLAESALELGERAEPERRRALETVRERYAHTPAAVRARELLDGR